MQNKFNSYYQNNELFTKTDKILLTVSGGRDSVAMVQFFLATEINIGIAHCNFKLRGEDANLDEEFVQNLASKNSVPFYKIHFNTKEFASKQGISIQMAARELRYNWFEKIRQENNFQYIATAHHQNDVAETMLINLTKGTGLAGLHGIRNKTNFIVRPMLYFSRDEINRYITKQNIPYREDQSNSDTKYFRNAIRHQIIPVLEKLNPSIINTLNEESNRFLDVEIILEQKIIFEKEKCFEYDGDNIKINIQKLLKLTPLKTYLYYFIKEFGFNFSDVEDIILGLENQSGKKYSSATHIMVKDRDSLLLKKIGEHSLNQVVINRLSEIPFNQQLIESSNNLKINKSSKYAYLDADSVQFPLTLRTWKRGDVFQPFGMKGNKKISDFLIDKKVSVIDKENIKVLADFNDQILWLVGYRINDNYKITSATKTILILSV